MKFSYSWLKDWINLSESAEEIAEKLTMGGVEVEELQKAAPEFSGVVVAEVLEVVKHPNADRLRVTKVNVGQGEPIQIVCGAPNVEPGLKVPCALSGAILPGNFKIKPTKMRGEESNGMLCSGKELGIPDDVDGLLVLDSDAPVGTSIREYLNLDDAIIELKITPNRSDCLSLKGIAREVQALTGVKAQEPSMKEIEASIQDRFEPRIEAKNNCGRFITRVIKGVDRKVATPQWMKDRLERSGIRTIEFLVDVGNYVMLELGQPLHVFDLDKLDGALIARRAQNGEKLTCLNGKTVELKENTLVIADEKKVLSLAGLMGGEFSAVSESTQNVCIESAWFNPNIIMGKSRQYEFGSDSSYRFERGVDYLLQEKAAQRASELIVSIAGGEAGPISEALGELPQAQEVSLRFDRARHVMGVDIPNARMVEILDDLQLQPQVQGEKVVVKQPSFRFDIEIEEDLIEEVARIYGYQNVPYEDPYGRLIILKESESQTSTQSILKLMSSMGYQEVINYAFCKRTLEEDFCYNEDPIQLQNPLVADADVMRSSLIGSLVDNLIYNLKRKQDRVKIFEIAQVFRKFKEGETPEIDVSFKQVRKIAGLFWGNVLPEGWANVSSKRKVDFFDLKGEILKLISLEGMQRNVEFVKEEHKSFHPGRSAMVIVDGQKVGMMGELHPKWVQKYELGFAPLVFEFDLDVITHKTKVKYEPISKFPESRRDLALLTPDELTFEELLAILTPVCKKHPTIQEIGLFDVYKGPGVEENKKSMAIKIIFSNPERTMQDEEMDSALKAFVEVASQNGLVLR